MSKIETKKFTCPKCHKESDFIMYESVNVSLDPSLREKVLTGELFQWTCPECGETFTVMYDFLYHDMKKQFMIYFSPNGCESINSQTNEMLEKFKGMRGSTYRSTDDFNRLKEKIFILENDLNDIAIEFGKVLIKFDKESKVPVESELYFESIVPGDGEKGNGVLLFRQFLDDKPQEGMVILPKEGYDQYADIVETEERFKMTAYCDTINESWILKKFENQ